MLAMGIRTFALALAAFVGGTWTAGFPPTSAPEPQYQVEWRLSPRALAQAVPDPKINAFGLSPDGGTLALFVGSGYRAENIPAWLVLVSVASGKILHKAEVGNLAPYWGFGADWPPQILFTPDGERLIVQALGRVAVMSAATLRTERVLKGEPGSVAVSICGSSGNGVVAVSFAKNWRKAQPYTPLAVHVEMVDAANGVVESSWEADDVPQSLSPDGTLAAVSDHAAGSASLPLAIVATNSGDTLAVLGTKYRFRKPRAGVNGVVVGQFLDDNRIVLGPDSGFDRSGRPSGRVLRIVDIRTGKVLQQIRPYRFGPTGEIAVANRGAEIVTASMQVPPGFYTHPHEVLPRDTVAKLLIFADRGGQFRPAGLLVPRAGVARIAGKALPFQVSADGSTIAVGRTVFERSRR